MDAAELELHMGISKSFILADPEDLVLKRQEKVSDGAGGFSVGPEVKLAPQTFRLIPQSDRVVEVADSNGRMSTPEWIIMGEVGCDMERYDYFTWKGKE